MGGASNVCAQKKVRTGLLSLTCGSGLLVIDDLTVGGMISSNAKQSFHCLEESIWAPENENKGVANCTSTFDQDTFKARLSEKCHGKKQCTVDITGLQPSGAEPSCGDEAFIYAQSSCQIPEDTTVLRKIFGLLVGCVGVFVYLFTAIYYDYMKTVQMLKYVDWDVKTISAGDYTVEFDIAAEVFQFWKKYYLDETNQLSENTQFKLYIQTELEKRLTYNVEHQDFEDKPSDGSPYKVKIS